MELLILALFVLAAVVAFALFVWLARRVARAALEALAPLLALAERLDGDREQDGPAA